MAVEAAKEYQSSLEELTFNSKLHINVLTMLAEENVNYADNIVQAIEKHIHQAPPDKKLPTLYLMDSILKNLRNSPYTQIFAQNIVNTFVAVFEKVDEKKRQSMYKLRQTWSDIFSNSKLYAIDVRIHSIDPAWPITARPPDAGVSSIHVNPKFLTQQQQLDENLKLQQVKEAEEASRLQAIEEEQLRKELVEEETKRKEEGELKRRREEEERKKWEDEQERKMRDELLAKHQELMRLQQQRLELELEETRRALLDKENQLKLKEEKEECEKKKREDREKQEQKRKEEEMRLRAEMELRKNLEIEIKRKTEEEMKRKAEARRKAAEQRKGEHSFGKNAKQSRDPRMRGQIKPVTSMGKPPVIAKETRNVSPDKKVEAKSKDETKSKTADNKKSHSQVKGKASSVENLKKDGSAKRSDSLEKENKKKEAQDRRSNSLEKDPIKKEVPEKKGSLLERDRDGECKTEEPVTTRGKSAVDREIKDLESDEARPVKEDKQTSPGKTTEVSKDPESSESRAREKRMQTRSKSRDIRESDRRDSDKSRDGDKPRDSRDGNRGRDNRDSDRLRDSDSRDSRDSRESDSSLRGRNNERDFRDTRDADFREGRSRRGHSERDWPASRTRSRGKDGHDRDSRHWRGNTSPARDSLTRSGKFKDNDRDVSRNSRNYRAHRRSKSPSSDEDHEEMLALRPKRYSPNRMLGSSGRQRRSRSSNTPDRSLPKKSKHDGMAEPADSGKSNRNEEKMEGGESNKSSTPKRTVDDKMSDEDLHKGAPPAKKSKDSIVTEPEIATTQGGMSSDFAELFGTEDVDYRHMKLPPIPRKSHLNEASDFSSPQQKGWAKFKENRPAEFPFQQPRRLSVDMTFRSPLVKQMSNPALMSPSFSSRLDPVQSPIISFSDIENILQQADTQLIRGRMSYMQYGELQKQLQELQRLQAMMADMKSVQKSKEESVRRSQDPRMDRMQSVPKMEPPPRPFILDERESAPPNRGMVSPPFNAVSNSPQGQPPQQKPALLESPPKKGLLDPPPKAGSTPPHATPSENSGLLETPSRPILLEQSDLLMERKTLLETPEKPSLLGSPRKTLLGKSPNETLPSRGSDLTFQEAPEKQLKPFQRPAVEDKTEPKTVPFSAIKPIPPPPVPPSMRTIRETPFENETDLHFNEKSASLKFPNQKQPMNTGNRPPRDIMDTKKKPETKIISIFDLNIEKPKGFKPSETFTEISNMEISSDNTQMQFKQDDFFSRRLPARNRTFSFDNEDVPSYDEEQFYVPEYDPRWVSRHRHYRESKVLNQYELVINGSRCYQMKVGGAARLISFSEEHKKKVHIDPKNKEVMINQTCYTRVGEPERTVVIGGKKYKIIVQGQLKRFWIDGNLYELRIDAPAKMVNIAGKTCEMRLDSQFRQVFLDGIGICPIDLNKPQKVTIHNVEHTLQFTPPPRRILIDDQLCELNLAKKFPTIMVRGEEHGIRFNGESRLLLIDGRKYTVYMDKPSIIKIGGMGKPYTVSFGGPGHEVIIDELWFEVKFNGPPVFAQVGTRTIELQIPGPPPDVKILAVIKPADKMHNMHGTELDGSFPEKGRKQSRKQKQSRDDFVLEDSTEPNAGGDFRKDQESETNDLQMNMRMQAPQMPPRPNVPVPPRFGRSPFTPQMERLPMAPKPPVGPSTRGPLIGGPKGQQFVASQPFPPRPLMMPSVGFPQPANAAQPQAPLAIPQLDVGDLFSKLVSAGIINRRKSSERSGSPMPAPPPQRDSPVPMDTTPQPTMQQAESAVPNKEMKSSSKAPEEDLPDTVPDLTDLSDVKLKKTYKGIVRKLYCGIQCNSCGARFKDEKSEKYKEHLDWHFRQNKREKEDSKVIRNRRWYYSIDDWAQFEELGDIEERFVSNYFENMLQSIHQAIGGNESSTLESTAESCPVASSKDEENVCVICGDPFEQFYDDDEEEWHLRDAIRVDNKTYHPVCYEDAKDDKNLSSLLETPTPDPQEVKKLPDPINDPLAYLSALSQQAKQTNQSLDAVAKQQIKTEPTIANVVLSANTPGPNLKKADSDSSLSSMFNIINNPPVKVKTEPKEDKIDPIISAVLPVKSEAVDKKEGVVTVTRKDPRLAAKAAVIKNDPRTVAKNNSADSNANLTNSSIPTTSNNVKEEPASLNRSTPLPESNINEQKDNHKGKNLSSLKEDSHSADLKVDVIDESAAKSDSGESLSSSGLKDAQSSDSKDAQCSDSKDTKCDSDRTVKDNQPSKEEPMEVEEKDNGSKS